MNDIVLISQAGALVIVVIALLVMNFMKERDHRKQLLKFVDSSTKAIWDMGLLLKADSAPIATALKIQAEKEEVEKPPPEPPEEGTL